MEPQLRPTRLVDYVEKSALIDASKSRPVSSAQEQTNEAHHRRNGRSYRSWQDRTG